MRRILQGMGAELIIAIGSCQGGHVEYFKYMIGPSERHSVKCWCAPVSGTIGREC